MNVSERLARSAVVPVVVLDDAKENYVFPVFQAEDNSLGEVVMDQYTERKVLSASDNDYIVATAIVLPYTYSANSAKKPRFKIEYVEDGEIETKSISLSLRNANQDITLGRGQSRNFILKNPNSFSPDSDDDNSVLDNLYVDDADGNMVDNDDDVW